MSMSKTKRQKTLKSYQGVLDTFFKQPKRLVCKGSMHQGDINGGGRQCTCIALAFMLDNTIPKTRDEIDNILLRGTDLYHKVCTTDGYMLITEFPENIFIENESFSITMKDPMSGLVEQESDNSDALTFTLESALHQSLAQSETSFITLGSNPGSTIGLKKAQGILYCIDSHSRNDMGLCVPSGKAVVLSFSSCSSLISHIKDINKSITDRFAESQFEITPLVSSKLRVVDSDVVGDVQAFNSPRSTDYETDIPNIEHTSHEMSIDEESTFHCDNGSNNKTSGKEVDESFVSINENNVETVDTQNDESCMSCNDNNDETSGTGDDESPIFNNERNEETAGIPVDDTFGSQLSDDIGVIDVHTLSDDVKFRILSNRCPEPGFKFPFKLYNDKRCKSGTFKRSCCRDWFEQFPFIAYSKLKDGLYCLACKFFPDTSGRRPRVLVTEPFNKWKDTTVDLKKHAQTGNHADSMVRLNGFKKSCVNQSHRIDVNLQSNNAAIIAKNRDIIRSMLKCLEFCGRRGMALRGHRDDDTGHSKNKGNFKELIQFRINAGDTTLKQHFETCSKVATYTSNTSQNELLTCIKTYIQKSIVEEVKSQPFGGYFGIQCDEVSDTSNWEQLGLVLRYVVDGVPVERLLEFILAEETTGESLCNLVVQSLASNGLDIQLCRSQTMDGAGNMSGKNVGCAARLTRISPRAMYHYCASHNLSLVLCKSCKVTEIHLMLDSLKQLGIFFKYSPKRSRRLETAVEDINNNRQENNKISKSKFKIFCETRWTEKHATLDTFATMYEALVACLEGISSNEGRSWDRKAITDAHGLLSKITDSTFIICFQTVHNFFGYVRGVSSKLQGSSLDIVEGYKMIGAVKQIIDETRKNEQEFDLVYSNASDMAVKAGLDELKMPRRCARQTHRNNVPASSDKEYFKRAIYLPYLDELIQQLDMRFGQEAVSVVRALSILPFRVHLISEEMEKDVYDYYNTDMPSPETFRQEMRLWKSFWENQSDKPESITSTLTDVRACSTLFPNIMKVLFLLALTSVTSSSTERANSSLKLIKNDLRSTMKEDRLNALLLLYIHRDIKLDFDKIIDDYAMRNPRKMVLMNPL